MLKKWRQANNRLPLKAKEQYDAAAVPKVFHKKKYYKTFVWSQIPTCCARRCVLLTTVVI